MEILDIQELNRAYGQGDGGGTSSNTRRGDFPECGASCGQGRQQLGVCNRARLAISDGDVAVYGSCDGHLLHLLRFRNRFPDGIQVLLAQLTKDINRALRTQPPSYFRNL